MKCGSPQPTAETDSDRPGLADACRARTRALHGAAERGGIMRALLRGRVSAAGYALLLRTLLPAYRVLEYGLRRHRESPGVAPLAAFDLARAAAIEADLVALSGPEWRRSLPLLAAGGAYARRIAKGALGDGRALVAHAYVRYLGDLNGGQVIATRLSETIGLPQAALNFYRFGDVADLPALRTAYRAAIDAAGREMADTKFVIEEAAAAFAANIAVSEAVEAALLAATTIPGQERAGLIGRA